MALDNLKLLAKRIEALKGVSVVVGIPSSEAHKAGEGITVLEKAIIHEFGTEHIPERSFLRSTFAEKKNNTVEILGVETKKYLNNGGDVKNPYSKAGGYLAAEVRETIISGINPPLMQATIDHKKSSKPLIDTGQLLNSITYEVRNDA